MNAGKTPKGTKTKARIIDAAIKLINRTGGDSVTLVEVCSEADVAQGTFYHYFKSINDILYEILRIEGDEIAALHERVRTEPYTEQLKKVLEFQMDYYEHKGKAVVARIFRNEFVPEGGESQIEKLLPTRKFVTRIIDEGQQSGVFSRAETAEQTGITLFSLLLTYSYWWIRDTSELTLKDIAGPHILSTAESIILQES